MASRSISGSLEEGLLAELAARGCNRLALVSEAQRDGLARRRFQALDTAYAHLAALKTTPPLPFPAALAHSIASMASPATTPNPSPQLLRWRGRTEVFMERCEGLELAMVRIPAGEFEMGSPPEEAERSEDEGPRRRVTLGEFLLGRTPITQAQWRVVARWEPPAGERWQRELDPEPSHFQPERRRESEALPNPLRLSQSSDRAFRFGTFAPLEGEETSDQRPVECVSWHEAMEFCRRLNSRLGAGAGRTYTLPREAQWEYACRAGTTTPFAFGETLTAALANYNASATYGNGSKGEYRQQTTPVGMFPANAWGLQDMHGNVWEWCLDDWHESYEGAPEDGSAWLIDETGLDRGKGEEMRRKGRESGAEGKEPGAGRRLLRGGSWIHNPGDCRSAYRYGVPQDFRDDYCGFRVCCLPQDPSLNT
jgi:formylglycine-generating enzyme required for sulfatase activity